MTARLRAAAALLTVLVGTGASAQTDDRFPLTHFEVSGSRFLSDAEVARLTAPYTGPARVFGDIQKALEAIENAYRRAGYSAVQVTIPEQELTGGVVRIEVVEVPLGQVRVTGNTQFSDTNVRASLPALRPGVTPNGLVISRQVQLANENPAKQTEVILNAGAANGTIDADVRISETPIERVYLTADNTGTRTTGRTRVGVAWQHANLFDRDHALTLAYTTSPDKPANVKVDVLSAAYHVPLYAQGASVDVVYGYSNVSTPTQSGAPGGGLGITGKGNVLVLRYTAHAPRRGNYTSRWVAGFDWKAVESACVTGSGAPLTGTAGCVDFVTTPLSLTYGGRLDTPARVVDYSAGLAWNLPVGSRHAYPSATSPAGNDRFTLAAGNRRSRDDFAVLRLSGSVLQPLGAAWGLRVGVTAQSSFGTALVSTEQIGLAGSTAVRGFLERIVAADTGIVAQVEVQSPELGERLGLRQGTLHGVVFYDTAWGRLHNSSGTDGAQLRLASWGVGARYTWTPHLSLRLDAAQILDTRPAAGYRGSDPRTGGLLDDNTLHDWRVHAALTWAF